MNESEQCTKRHNEIRKAVTAKLDYVFTGQTEYEFGGYPLGPVEAPGEVTAVVMRWRNSKVYICVEEAGKTKARIFSVYPTRLTPLGGELMPVCQHCSRPMDIEVPEWKCRPLYDMETGAEDCLECEARKESA